MAAPRQEAVALCTELDQVHEMCVVSDSDTDTGDEVEEGNAGTSFGTAEKGHTGTTDEESGTTDEEKAGITDEEEVGTAVGTTGTEIGTEEGHAGTTEEAQRSADGQSVRKRHSDPAAWKQNSRKRLYQGGKAHTNSKNKKVSAKQIRNLKDCSMSCKFKCAQKVTPDEREKCFIQYYELSQDRKYDYIAMSTECGIKEKKTSGQNSRRTYSYKYFLNLESDKIRVCKQFYLGTFGISQKPVYSVHMKKNRTTGVPKPSARGKHTKKKLDEKHTEQVKAHILSFPIVESHYCRSRTTRQFLESTLNVSRMHELYKLKCSEEGKSPVKLSYYRFIFNTNFNLGFHVPKKDRCDQCEAYEVAVKNNLQSQCEIDKQTKHMNDKIAMRQELQKDREDKETLAVCFDLQNVISCPRAEVSSFFYKRKLNLYNLTAHSSKTKSNVN